MSDFNYLWNKHIAALQGHEIKTVTGKLNKILLVTDQYLERISFKGEKSKVSKSFFENVYDDLLQKKTITRAEINAVYGKRCSSIVTVILAELPNVVLIKTPAIGLRIN